MKPKPKLSKKKRKEIFALALFTASADLDGMIKDKQISFKSNKEFDKAWFDYACAIADLEISKINAQTGKDVNK